MFKPVFTHNVTDEYECFLEYCLRSEEVERTACIKNHKNEVVFKREKVFFPEFYSQTAVNIITSKYMQEKETRFTDVINRIILALNVNDEIFKKELAYILFYQLASFNSPVWFNLGVKENPQCSACFILGIEDNMHSIFDVLKTEALIFKDGSGTGINFSKLRAAGEKLSSGGTASGPISFMKGYDAFAGVIKSGGKTRRAAKMVMLDIDHPDILDFINCKTKEEKKVKALVESGYGSGIDGEAYKSVFFQNGNHSIRVTADFMHKVINKEDFYLQPRKDGEPIKIDADFLFDQIVASAYSCGDPGLQFHDTINANNPCWNLEEITGSNPCSEFMFFDDTACNLASINLKAVYDYTKKYTDIEFNSIFSHIIKILIYAQDCIVDISSYPTEKIRSKTLEFRPLGLGVTNLGSLLMVKGMEYGGDESLDYIREIFEELFLSSLEVSVLLAEKKSPFPRYYDSEQCILEYFENKGERVHFKNHIRMCNIYENLEKHGIRNAQLTAIAPTGTISLAMDAYTTGIEPEISLFRIKTMIDGGVIKTINPVFKESLINLGYSDEVINLIFKELEEGIPLSKSKNLNLKHVPIFNCAIPMNNDVYYVTADQHLDVMQAVQKYISGAISKTINLPNDSSFDMVKDIFIQAWEMGLKSVTVYRDGCKMAQPIQTHRKEDVKKDDIKPEEKKLILERKKLPIERKSLTHKFSIAGHEGYITVGFYPDGSPGEVFINMSKQGSTVSGLMDTIATMISLLLQYGIKLNILCDKFKYTRFEPSGFTGNSDISVTSSVVDYIFRWLENHFVKNVNKENKENKNIEYKNIKSDIFCPSCGGILMQSGTCHVCSSCGTTTGCS